MNAEGRPAVTIEPDPDRDPMPSIDKAAEQMNRELDSHMRRWFPVRYWLVRAGEWLSGRLRRDH